MKQDAIRRARDGNTQTLGRYRVLTKEHLDGVKFFLDAPIDRKGAEAWVLFRASGTEPLLRIYSESCSKESVKKLLEAAREFAMTSGD